MGGEPWSVRGHDGWDLRAINRDLERRRTMQRNGRHQTARGAGDETSVRLTCWSERENVPSRTSSVP